MSTESASSSMTLDLEMSAGQEAMNKAFGNHDKKVSERQLTTRTLTPSPLTLGKQTPDMSHEIEEERFSKYDKSFALLVGEKTRKRAEGADSLIDTPMSKK